MIHPPQPYTPVLGNTVPSTGCGYGGLWVVGGCHPSVGVKSTSTTQPRPETGVKGRGGGTKGVRRREEECRDDFDEDRDDRGGVPRGTRATGVSRSSPED